MASNLVFAGKLTHPVRSYPSHGHVVWEVILYTNGSGVARVGSTPIEFRAGTIICMPPNLTHEEHSPHGYQNIAVGIRDFNPASDIPVIHESVDHPIFSIASVLVIEYRLKRPSYDVIVHNLFDTFMLYLNEWQVKEPHDQLLFQLQRRLIDNIQNPHFEVTDALEEFPLSKDHLRRLFKERIGMPPIQYLVELRMNRAKELLQAGHGIKDVASQVGLPDPYYFSRLFKRTQGKSPTLYKKDTAKKSGSRHGIIR